MTEKLSAFIDDALYTQEVKSLLNELASDSNKTTLELYLLTREILQNNHSLMLRENLSERILQSIHQEMQKNTAASSNSKKRLLWRPSFAIAAVFMLGIVGTMTWWSTKTSPENQARLTAVSDLTADDATLSTVSSESVDNNQLTAAKVAEADNTSSKLVSGEQDGFSLDPYLFAHQELAPMGGFHEPLPYVRTVSGTK
jgi:hypothetical protein